jgi:hypothetical protein
MEIRTKQQTSQAVTEQVVFYHAKIALSTDFQTGNSSILILDAISGRIAQYGSGLLGLLTRRYLERHVYIVL